MMSKEVTLGADEARTMVTGAAVKFKMDDGHVFTMPLGLVQLRVINAYMKKHKLTLTKTEDISTLTHAAGILVDLNPALFTLDTEYVMICLDKSLVFNKEQIQTNAELQAIKSGEIPLQ